MDIYIKSNKKVEIIGNPDIKIKHITKIIADESIKSNIENTTIFNIGEENKKIFIVDIMELIKIINKLYPDYTINNMGEPSTIIYYMKEFPKKRKLFHMVKIIFVCILIFLGSAVAVMSFNNDAQISKIFETFHKIIFNEETEYPLVLNLSYSLGLFLGIIMFFNHFGSKKLTDDPTPIEVEMTIYKNDVNDVLIDILNNERDSNNDSNH